MPYPKGFLESRAVIKPGIFTIIPPEGRVINSVPGFKGCKLTIIASPKHGASFAQYVGSVEAGGKTLVPFVEAPGAETFLFVMDGDGELHSCRRHNRKIKGRRLCVCNAGYRH